MKALLIIQHYQEYKRAAVVIGNRSNEHLGSRGPSCIVDVEDVHLGLNHSRICEHLSVHPMTKPKRLTLPRIAEVERR